MVQVDVFWSYGLASGLALAAAPHIKKEENPWLNKYFVLTAAWITLFFAPSGIYLLWQFPYWETMFLAQNKDSIPAWLVVIFSVTNVSQGVLGYYVTYRLLRKGKDRAALFQTIWSHLAMGFILIYGWDGSGWTRFTYSGTGDEWFSGVPYRWTQFFSSPVFFTLVVMGLILIPTYAYLVRSWRTGLA
jgi:hypothetical protein